MKRAFAIVIMLLACLTLVACRDQQAIKPTTFAPAPEGDDAAGGVNSRADVQKKSGNTDSINP